MERMREGRWRGTEEEDEREEERREKMKRVQEGGRKKGR